MGGVVREVVGLFFLKLFAWPFYKDATLCNICRHMWRYATVFLWWNVDAHFSSLSRADAPNHWEMCRVIFYIIHVLLKVNPCLQRHEIKCGYPIRLTQDNGAKVHILASRRVLSNCRNIDLHYQWINLQALDRRCALDGCVQPFIGSYETRLLWPHLEIRSSHNVQISVSTPPTGIVVAFWTNYIARALTFFIPVPSYQ